MESEAADDQIRHVFRARQRMLIESARLAASGHHGLDGRRREDGVRTLLEGLLPHGMRVTGGLVVNGARKSREADAIIVDSRSAEIRWADAVPLIDAICAPWILEVKTTWRSDLFIDFHEKALAARSLNAAEFVSARAGQGLPRSALRLFPGSLRARPTRFGAIVLLGDVGGETVRDAVAKRAAEGLELPDLLLIAEAGLCVQWCESTTQFMTYDVGEDALLLFMHFLFEDLLDRDTIPEFVSPVTRAGERMLAGLEERRTAAPTDALE